MTRTLISAALASAAMLSVAQAQTIGTATTDLNLRSGPDPQFPVIGMIRENRSAIVLGCIEGSRWCQVDVRGQTGWAYSQYMTLSGDLVAVLPAPELEVNVASRPVIAAPPPAGGLSGARTGRDLPGTAPGLRAGACRHLSRSHDHRGRNHRDSPA